MVTSKKVDLSKYLQDGGEYGDESFFDDVNEIARASIERHMEEVAGRTRRNSNGVLRLTGDGVIGHSISLSAASSMLFNFQQLVTAIGASLEGNRSSRGKLPKAVKEETELNLTASPMPGSVVLNFEPNHSEQSKDSGSQFALPLDNTEKTSKPPLAERAVDEFLALFGFADLDGEGNQVIDGVEKAGPRVTKALEEFSSALIRHDIDVDLKWQRKGGRRQRILIKSKQAKTLTELLQEMETKTGNISVVGRIQKISDYPGETIEVRVIERESSDFIDEDFPTSITVDIPRNLADISKFHIRETVEMKLFVDKMTLPGKNPTHSFELQEISISSPSESSQ